MFMRTSCMRPNHRRLYTRYTGGVCQSVRPSEAPARFEACSASVASGAVLRLEAESSQAALRSAISSHSVSEVSRRSCSSLGGRLVEGVASRITRRTKKSHCRSRRRRESGDDRRLGVGINGGARWGCWYQMLDEMKVEPSEVLASNQDGRSCTLIYSRALSPTIDAC